MKAVKLVNKALKKSTHVCYCWKPGSRIACNYPKCEDYTPGNAKPYEDKYE